MRRCHRFLPILLGLSVLVSMAAGCRCTPAPGRDYEHVHANPAPDGAHYFTGGIETDTGYFAYLAFSTNLQLGGYPSAAPHGQRVMSNASTAPASDLPWIFVPDGWFYWTGDSGCVGTQVGTTCASGSTMIIQRNITVNGKVCDRFMMHRTHLTASGYVVVKSSGQLIPYLGRASSWIDVPWDGSAPMGPYGYDEDPKVNAQYRRPPGSEQLLTDITTARKANHVP